MPMLISKFHRLIQSRLLWASFLVIIVFSFVIWGTRMPSANRAARESSAAGKLNGQYVSQQEYRNAYFNTYMSTVLALGRQFEMTPKLDKDIRRSAWQRYISLQKAEEMGINTSDEEVTATIRNHPGFSQNGQFSQPQYNAFVQTILPKMGFTELQFEQHVREEITLQKLQHMLQQAVLLSPAEISRTYHSLSDMFDVDYVVLTTNEVSKEVKVTEQEAENYYKSDKEAFKIPEKVVVKYVAIPITNFIAAVSNSEEDALSYYDDHTDEFTVTNLVKMPARSITNAFETNVVAESVTSKVTTLTFDEVSTNILKALKWQGATDKASEIAMNLITALTPDREGKAQTFEQAAEKARLTVSETEPFGLEDPVPGIDADLSFNKAAFALGKAADESFSDPIISSNSVYVIAFDKKIPERIPEFKEVMTEAMDSARNRALNDALTKKAQDFREAAVKAVEKGGAFAKAASSFGLNVHTTGMFSVASGMETNEYAEILLRGILARNAGEITDPLAAEDAILIAHVGKRLPNGKTTLDSLKPQIESSMKKQRGRLVFEDWQDSLLKEAGFEDREAHDVVPDEEETATTNEPPATTNSPGKPIQSEQPDE